MIGVLSCPGMQVFEYANLFSGLRQSLERKEDLLVLCRVMCTLGNFDSNSPTLAFFSPCAFHRQLE